MLMLMFPKQIQPETVTEVPILQVRASLAAGITSVLRGTVLVQVVRGVATFTDLVVDIAPGSMSAGLTLDFTASVGLNVLRSSGKPFLALQRSSSIQIALGPQQRYRAGSLVGDIMVRMLDDAGNVVLNSNTPVITSIVSEDGTAVTSTALLGTSSVVAVRGQSNYTDLRVTQAGTFRLVFTAPFVNLTTRSERFTVFAGPYSGVKIVTQPVNTSAGISTSVRVMLTDEYANLNATSGVALRLTVQSASGDCCAGQVYTLPTVDGFVDFRSVLLTVARDDLFTVATIVYEESACLDQPSPDDVEMCPRRRDARSMSRSFRVASAEAYRVEVTQGAIPRSVAGEPFPRQPRCTVYDRYSNKVTDTYKVTASVVTSDGQGCLCDFQQNDLCEAASTQRTVQVCMEPAHLCRYRLYASSRGLSIPFFRFLGLQQFDENFPSCFSKS
jgi:hypothetical protein